MYARERINFNLTRSEFRTYISLWRIQINVFVIDKLLKIYRSNVFVVLCNFYIKVWQKEKEFYVSDLWKYSWTNMTLELKFIIWWYKHLFTDSTVGMFNTLKIGIRMQRIYYSLSPQTFLISSIRGFGRGLDSFSNTFGILLSRIWYYQVPRILKFIRKFPGSNVITKTCIFFSCSIIQGCW